FIVHQVTRDRIVRADPASSDLLKPVLQGEDLRPWYQEEEGRWLIVLPSGWTREAFGADLTEEEAWALFSVRNPALAAHLLPFAEAARKRWDKGHYWWELRSCDYYEAFDKPKIIWPDIAKLPRFSFDTHGRYVTDQSFM